MKYRDPERTLDNIECIASMAVGECRTVDAFDRTLKRILLLIAADRVESDEPDDFEDGPTPVFDAGEVE